MPPRGVEVFIGRHPGGPVAVPAAAQVQGVRDEAIEDRERVAREAEIAGLKRSVALAALLLLELVLQVRSAKSKEW